MASGKKSPFPYPPSWMDRFFDWVERLPIPFLLFYMLAYLALGLFQHALLWIDGSVPVGEFVILIFAQDLWFIFLAAARHYLRNKGSAALTKFRPALRLNDSRFARLLYEFTHLSARTGWIISALVVPILLISMPYLETYVGHLFFSPTMIYLTFLIVIFIGPMNVAFFYIVLRSLSVISRIYAQVRRINLFNLTPLYALSAFTSELGMIFVLFMLINLTTASLFGREFTLFYLILNGLMAALVFVLPLLGIHQRLGFAKERAVEVNNDLIEKGFSKMQSLVRASKHRAVSELRNSNSALLEYRLELAKISTWPWDTATLRTFITALLVPIIVWVLQQFLQRAFIR